MLIRSDLYWTRNGVKKQCTRVPHFYLINYKKTNIWTFHLTHLCVLKVFQTRHYALLHWYQVRFLDEIHRCVPRSIQPPCAIVPRRIHFTFTRDFTDFTSLAMRLKLTHFADVYLGIDILKNSIKSLESLFTPWHSQYPVSARKRAGIQHCVIFRVI